MIFCTNQIKNQWYSCILKKNGIVITLNEYTYRALKVEMGYVVLGQQHIGLKQMKEDQPAQTENIMLV